MRTLTGAMAIASGTWKEIGRGPSPVSTRPAGLSHHYYALPLFQNLQSSSLPLPFKPSNFNSHAVIDASTGHEYSSNVNSRLLRNSGKHKR